LAGALHEASNALTVVLGWIERARDDGDASPAGARALEVAIARARDAHRIVRAAIGAPVPGDEPRPLSTVVADAAVGLEPEARRAGVRLVTHIAPALDGAIAAAPSSALQILTNLLLNAIAFSPPGGVVTIDASYARSRASVAVSDEGPGVPADRRATLLEASVSTRAGGAGIGLRHAASLAKAAGGALAVADSERGARFVLSWPCRRAEPSQPGREPARPRIDLDGARVLVLDDDAAVVDLLDMALSARGARVVSIRGRAELASALSSGPFDAALFDLSPIADDVAGALRAVHGASPAARLILISGSSEGLPDMPGGVTAAWVRKPFEVGEILRALAPA
jgi:CheY-like chemotaxis protein